MSNNRKNDKYIDLKISGKLFPSWILANFKKYKLPEVITKGDEDPCSIRVKEELREYQKFISAYIDYNSPYRDILIYHGLGSGKTVSAINVYNMLYNYTPGWNVYLLIKAALKESTWIKELNAWLLEDDKQFRFGNIKFISYDAPNADKAFFEEVRNADSSKKSLYIIDEVHNFIRNVYSNVVSKGSKRMSSIYDHIIQDKKDNDDTRVVLLSATPAINEPFEIALLFNLLRPDIFPKNEIQFNQYYVSSSGYRKLNDITKNNFQRRIMGLVSYYIGATPDYFATKTINYTNVEMSEYQQEIYDYFEDIEEQIIRKSRGNTQTYKSYTRQACNFVFPNMGQGLTGELRPRAKDFKISEKETKKIDEGRLKVSDGNNKDKKYYNEKSYFDKLDKFSDTFDNYLLDKHNNDIKKGYTLENDIKDIDKYNDYNEFINKNKKSSLLIAMYECSSKMLNMIFNIFKSKGPVLVYSNYVLIEGLQIFKIYLKYFGYNSYSNKNTHSLSYMEYHGGIDTKTRKSNLEIFNKENNKYGDIVKIMMISPAGAEGLSLFNIRQVHIMEPHWNETRIIQMIGRAIRFCSHKMLPKNERHVDVYRYKSVKRNTNKLNVRLTADQEIEDGARRKEGLIQSFNDAIKEVSIDCVLNKTHNSLVQDIKCFQFEEQELFKKNIGPAYDEDLITDLKMDNGSNSMNSKTIRIKVNKISAVIQLSSHNNDNNNDDDNITYTQPKNYWYNPDTYVVYDYDLHYPIGKINVSDDGIPKTYNNSYIINQLVPIPLIN